MMSALDRLTATASQVPADDRLPKPFDLAQLLERVRYWATNAPSPDRPDTAEAKR
jgi:DNA-binding response OmpR family regulator